MKTLCLFTCLLGIADVAGAVEPCRIEVVEAGSGWPVPMVELSTTHNVRFFTDNAGIVAMDEPALMGVETWFSVEAHGYEMKADGFGFRGFRFVPEPGKVHRVEVARTNVAKRLGRITGAGLFAESIKAGVDPGWEEAPGVHGCDSIQSTVHRGRLFWLWGDTLIPRYPLGLFQASSATLEVQPLESFEPPLKLTMNYFRDEQGRPRNVAEMPGKGPTWVGGYVSLPAQDGKWRLVGAYSKIEPPLDTYEEGLCVWNDETENFEQHKVIWKKKPGEDSEDRPVTPHGHPAFWKDESGREWLLLGNPLPRMKIPATFEDWENPETWEVLEPQADLKSAADGKKVVPHSGSIAWNPWRQRWVTVFMEKFGKPSALGELWYAEADSPFGPWGPAVKVVSHNNYTFYNPRIHAGFTPEDSPVLLFEGTYTALFADEPEKTPRFDYNQILYRLDLNDPALKPAQER